LFCSGSSTSSIALAGSPGSQRHLVDLVDQQNRVLRLGVAERRMIVPGIAPM
jgi:hypothetical protein